MPNLSSLRDILDVLKIIMIKYISIVYTYSCNYLSYDKKNVKKKFNSLIVVWNYSSNVYLFIKFKQLAGMWNTIFLYSINPNHTHVYKLCFKTR